MERGRARLRRARSLFAYWHNDQLHFRNPAQQLTVSGPLLTVELLDFFTAWRTTEEAVTHFSSYTPQSVRSSVTQLHRQSLLLREKSPAAKLDEAIARAWETWLPDGSFHFSTKDARYVQRERTLAEWKAILPKTARPKIFKSLRGAERISLPAPILPDSEFVRVLMERKTHREFSKEKVELEKISLLLSLVWGVTGYLESKAFGRLLRKTSPSGGARHPGEVYLMALRVKGLKAGLYHYHPGRNQLERISARATSRKARLYCAFQEYPGEAAALFLMTAVFERTMWKYPRARAYRVVLLDAGHLAQTFCLVATWLGLAPYSTAALKDTLIERDLGIDGVRESVLYVLGVGLPAG